MSFFNAYDSLPVGEQWLHQLHFALCCFAVLVGCVPLAVAKGSTEHRWAGLVYLPVSGLALLLAAGMAWREQSFLLFAFSCFCGWLLLSGWRAVHEKNAPKLIDWLIPGGLIALAAAVALHALTIENGTRSLSLLFFALNAAYLGLRDWRALIRRAAYHRSRLRLAGVEMMPLPASAWLNRHVAGMAGSLLANLSVVVLTILPLGWHWLWPAVLMLAGAIIYLRERQKKARIRAVLAPVLKPGFGRTLPGVATQPARKRAA